MLRDVMDVLRQVISAEPPPIEQLAPHVPPAVGSVLRHALSKDPDQRFANILDFASALLRASGTSLPPPVDALGVAHTLPAGPLRLAHGDRYQTGLRAKTPTDVMAPTIANSFTPDDLSRALDMAREMEQVGVRVWAMAAEEARMLYHAMRGETEAVRRCRERVD